MFICKEVMAYWPSCRPDNEDAYVDQSSGLFGFARGATQFLTLLALLVFLRRQANKAELGRLTAQEVRRSLIFPVYVGILWVLAVSNLGTSVVDMLRPFSCEMDQSASLKVFMAVLFGLSWGLYHLVIAGVAIMFLFRGVGGRANVLAFLCALWWAVVTAVLHFFMAVDPENRAARLGEIIWDGVLMVFFAVMTLAPAASLYRRPSAAGYCRFFFLCRTIQFVGDLLIHPGVGEDAGHCFNALSGSGFLSIFAPYVVYRALLHDCWYWQGTLANSGANESSVRDPLDGLTLEPEAARAIAMELGNAAVSPAPGRFGGRAAAAAPAAVHLINIAELVIDYHGEELSGDAGRRQQPKRSSSRGRPVILGQGGSAKVYKGRWKDIPVAIKMIWFTELTPADIRRFHTEAVLLSQLQHPNVVQIYGVCVHPPCLCLVMELCAGGSLRQLLDNSSFPDPTDSEAMVAAARSGKPPLTLDQRLDLARQCADALHFLHSQDPPVLHQDLKCSNFLVDSDGVVKISDLELSREIVRVSSKQPRRKDGRLRRESASGRSSGHGRGWLSRLSSRWGRRRRKPASMALLSKAPRSDAAMEDDEAKGGPAQGWDTPAGSEPPTEPSQAGGLGVEDSAEDEDDDDGQFDLWFMSGAGMGQPDTINWLAPEVIAQEGCGPPSDVYSLGMVVWEILTGKVPFEDDMNLSKPKFNPDGSRIVELPAAVAPARPQAWAGPAEMEVAEVDSHELEQESKQREFDRRSASLGVTRTGGGALMRSIPVVQEVARPPVAGRAQAALTSISAALGLHGSEHPGQLDDYLARKRAARKAAEDRRWFLPPAGRQGRSNSEGGSPVSSAAPPQDSLLRQSLLGDTRYRTFQEEPAPLPPPPPPVEDEGKDARLRHRILREEHRPALPEWTPMEVRALVLQMWRMDPLDRPPASLASQILGMVCDDKGVRPRALDEYHHR